MVLLGIDIGTSGCKITAIDEAGKVLDEGFAEYATSHPSPGFAEQNPDDWCDAVREILSEMRSRNAFDFQNVAALAVDGSTHNAVLLDEHMHVIRPTIMWTDQRSVQQSMLLNDRYGDLVFDTAYQAAAPTWTLPQLMWLKQNEPQTLQQTRHIMFVKDYVRWRMTDQWVTDRIDAQGTLFFDMAKQSWSESLLDLVGLKTDVLPALLEPTDIAGRISEKGASEFGLPQGLPVICGSSDAAIEDYAAGAITPGSCILKLATAGNVNVMTDKPVPNTRTLTYSHIIPGMWFTVVATNSAARCQRWFRDVFYRDTQLPTGVKNIYQWMDQLAVESCPGAGRLMFHPYLQGERAPYWDADLRASFVGATMQHTQADFIRALLEGVVFSLRDCFRTIEQMQLPVTEFRLIGGGAKSELWSQIIADVFGKPVLRPQACDASFGSALLAGVGIGVFADQRAAVNTCLTHRDPVHPDPQNQAVYEKSIKLYYRIHDVLADVYHEYAQD